MFKHLNYVNMTFIGHMKLSLYFSCILTIGSLKAFIHAFFPDMFTTSTNDLVINIEKILIKHRTNI